MKLRLFNLLSSLFCAVTLIGCESGSIPDTFTSLAFKASGEPWFISLACEPQGGCSETILYHLQNDIWIPINPLNPGTRFFSLLIDSDNQVWVSASDGSYQIINNQPNLVSHLIVSSWIMDQTGKIWVIGRDPSVDNRLSLWVTNP